MKRRLRKLLGALVVLQSAYLHADYSTLMQKIDAVRQRENISSLVVLITDDRRIRLSKALGQPSHGSSETMTLYHYIRIGSISKMFTGLALLQLQKKHLIDLSTPVASLIDQPPFDNPWQYQYPVRVAHLLEHTAGLSDLSAEEFKFNTPVTLTKAFSINPASRQLRWRPGFHSSYSNTGAGIAAYLIEQTTRETFETFVKDEVFVPMGLASATYFPTTEVLADLVTGYDKDGKTKIPYWHTLYRAFAGINIRPVEMSRVIQMYLANGIIDGKRVFKTQAIKRMETPLTTLAAQSGLEYGYGLGLYHFVHSGFEFIGHGGDADGYLSYLAYSRSLNLGYFVSINAYNNKASREIRHMIEDELIESASPPMRPPVVQFGKESVQRIEGTYVPVTYRFGSGPSDKVLKIVMEDGVLFTIHGGRKRVLIAVNSNHYRRRNDPVATIAIIERDGELYLQGDSGNFRKRKTRQNQ